MKCKIEQGKTRHIHARVLETFDFSLIDGAEMSFSSPFSLLFLSICALLPVSDISFIILWLLEDLPYKNPRAIKHDKTQVKLISKSFFFPQPWNCGNTFLIYSELFVNYEMSLPLRTAGDRTQSICMIQDSFENTSLQWPNGSKNVKIEKLQGGSIV